MKPLVVATYVVICAVIFLVLKIRVTVVYIPTVLSTYDCFGNIPRIMHQSYDRWDDIPPCCLPVIRENQRRLIGWKYIFYDESARRNVCAAYGEHALNAYEKLKKGAQKTDLFRYCALFLYGGMYLDIKTSVTSTETGPHQKQVDELLQKESRLLYAVWPLTWRSTSLFTSLFTSSLHAVTSILLWPAHHPVMHCVVEECCRRIQSMSISSIGNSRMIPHITGPEMYTSVVTYHVPPDQMYISYTYFELFKHDGTNGEYYNYVKSRKAHWSQL